ncbi:MAG: hypothetical protein SAqPseu_38790 [Shewanella algae]
MKDVVTCDKLRLGSNSHLSLRFPNGETQLHKQLLLTEYIG